jgi:PEP-CTERM motif
MTECKNWVHWMATIKGARTVALAAAIAGGMLCEALICEPAQAQVATTCSQAGTLAFLCTQNNAAPDLYVSLELFDGSTEFTVSALNSQVFEGSVSNSNTTIPPSSGGPNGGNNNYAVGITSTRTLADYFGFNLSKVPATFTVTSATLVVYSGAITANLKLALVGATQYASEIFNPPNPSQTPTLYNNLVNQANVSYGIFSLSENTGDAFGNLMFTLNAAATTEINTQIQAKGLFVVSGSVTDVPEPSTWVMMLAGFAGLGVVASRRAARRRAAAAAG